MVSCGHRAGEDSRLALLVQSSVHCVVVSVSVHMENAVPRADSSSCQRWSCVVLSGVCTQCLVSWVWSPGSVGSLLALTRDYD